MNYTSNVIIDPRGNNITLPIGSRTYQFNNTVIIEPAVFGVVRITNLDNDLPDIERRTITIIGAYTDVITTMTSPPPDVNNELIDTINSQSRGSVIVDRLAIESGTYLVDSQLIIDVNDYNSYCANGTWGTTPRLCLVERINATVRARQFEYFVFHTMIGAFFWIILGLVIIVLIAERRGKLL